MCLIHLYGMKVDTRRNYEYSAYAKTYPFILGTDVSGTVEEVGEGVTRFQKGDRVISCVPATLTPPISKKKKKAYTN